MDEERVEAGESNVLALAEASHLHTLVLERVQQDCDT